MTHGRVLDIDVTEEISVWCDRQPDGTYELDWVESNGPESYATLDLALARAAVLVRAIHTERFMTHENTDVFALDAGKFLEDQLDTHTFNRGDLVRVGGAYNARFEREERNPDGRLNGVALVRIVSHPDAAHIGREIHVGVSVLELA